jgi:hypothetical protein
LICPSVGLFLTHSGTPSRPKGEGCAHADKAFQNARDNTPHTARVAHDQALSKVMQILLKDDTQVYKPFVKNESFRRFVGDMVFELTRQAPAMPGVLWRPDRPGRS